MDDINLQYPKATCIYRICCKEREYIVLFDNFLPEYRIIPILTSTRCLILIPTEFSNKLLNDNPFQNWIAHIVLYGQAEKYDERYRAYLKLYFIHFNIIKITQTSTDNILAYRTAYTLMKKGEYFLNTKFVSGSILHLLYASLNIHPIFKSNKIVLSSNAEFGSLQKEVDETFAVNTIAENEHILSKKLGLYYINAHADAYRDVLQLIIQKLEELPNLIDKYFFHVYYDFATMVVIIKFRKLADTDTYLESTLKKLFSIIQKHTGLQVSEFDEQSYTNLHSYYLIKYGRLDNFCQTLEKTLLNNPNLLCNDVILKIILVSVIESHSNQSESAIKNLLQNLLDYWVALYIKPFNSKEINDYRKPIRIYRQIAKSTFRSFEESAMSAGTDIVRSFINEYSIIVNSSQAEYSIGRLFKLEGTFDHYNMDLLIGFFDMISDKLAISFLDRAQLIHAVRSKYNT